MLIPPGAKAGVELLLCQMGAPLTPPEGRLKKKEEKEQLNKQNVDKQIDLN